MKTEPYFEAWALLDANGKVSDCEEERGIGVIYGVDLETVLEISKTLWINLEIEEKPEATLVNFKVTNITHEEGQQTFPETCQWDFLPYFEYHVEDIKFDLF